MMRNIDTAIRRSVQEFPEAMGFGHFLISIAGTGDIIPDWGTSQPARDKALREFWPTEPWLASATASLAARNAAFSWTLEGPQRTCSKIQEMLHLSDFGKGWVDLLLKISTDLYTQDNGAFIELIREGIGPNSPLLCLAHLDSARCSRTGDPKVPVVYTDLKGGQHKMAAHQVLMLTDMPSPREDANGVGMCAVSRVLRAAQILRDTALRKHEKLTGRFTGAVHIISGVTLTMIEDAFRIAEEESNNRNRLRYQPPMIVGTLDPTAEVKVATIPLADIPEGMNEEDERKWYIAVLALGFGCEYQDLAPLPGGNLGTSQQSETLHLTAKGKGPELFQKLITHALNFYVLPQNITFKFDEKDYQAEEIEGNVKKLRAETKKLYVEGGIITPDVARQMMEDDGDLKHEYLEMMAQPDITPEGEVEDEEREEETPPVEGQDLLPDEQGQKFNPYHDELGRFAEGLGGEAVQDFGESRRERQGAMDKWVSKEFRIKDEEGLDWEKRLPEQEMAAVEQYREWGYEPINNYLRTGKPLSPIFEHDMSEQQAKTATTAIDKAIASHHLSEGITVYRGLRGDTLAGQKLTEGMLFTDKGFISTSLRYWHARGAFASNQTSLLVKITLPKGTSAAYLGHTEHELLLGRGSVFRLRRIRTDEENRRIVEVDYVGTAD